MITLQGNALPNLKLRPKLMPIAITAQTEASTPMRRPQKREPDQVGQVHGSQLMSTFLNWNKPPLAIVAGRVYGSMKIRQAIAREGALAVIPSQANAREPVLHVQNERHETTGDEI